MNTRLTKRIETALSIVAAGALVSLVATAAPAHAHDSAPKSKPFIDNFSTVTQGDTSAPTAGPEAGDQNPYGVAVVPRSVGKLIQGNILVSNFNNVGNLQGTGTSIVQYSPDVQTQTTFAEIDASTLPGACPGGVGLTTALAVLRTGWVIVGSRPTSDGSSATAQAGCLIVLDSNGNVAETFSDSLINGPWDMTALDSGSSAALFVTNALNGTVAAGGKITLGGTVIRLDLTIRSGSMPSLQAITTIGSGFAERTDPGALVIGPTGVALSK